MKDIKIHEIIGSNIAVTAKSGQEVFKVIKQYISDNTAVILDFTGIDTLTTAFLNTAIGQLYDLKSGNELRELVKLQKDTISESHRKKIVLVLSNSKEKRDKIAHFQNEVLSDGD